MLKKMRVPFELKALSEAGEFEGYGSVFGVKDHGSDIVMPGAFTDSLIEWKGKNKLPPVLWQHKTHEPIGPHTDMKEDEKGLYVKGQLLIDDDPLARRAHAHMKAGSVTGLSIGYTLDDWEWDSVKGAYLLKKITLWEVSVVTFAMNEAAYVTDVKSLLERGETPPPSKVERALREVGFSGSQAKAFMAKGYGAVSPREAGADEALQSLKSLLNRM
ncbi:HK97 family phage prohead protease [Pseudomonas kielensis]|uniref:HK97 family phage prohead protease n=1 Tax=Pseudomonas kielensis TaxID=2762577 RepID=UPI00265D6387|nr:HK97 family phage prohead protease [Pseudomonas kielensis]WKL53336.1 HK97 family phage prohead protease [Pseudomonas kielensis]